jgi:hypothetical protein
MIEPTKERIISDTTVALVQFMQAHDGDLTMLPGLLFDLKEVAMHHGVTDTAADADCSDVDA